jgi:hypothetical protein
MCRAWQKQQQNEQNGPLHHRKWTPAYPSESIIDISSLGDFEDFCLKPNSHGGILMRTEESHLFMYISPPQIGKAFFLICSCTFHPPEIGQAFVDKT